MGKNRAHISYKLLKIGIFLPFFIKSPLKHLLRTHLGMGIFAVGLARKRTCTGFADKHCKPTREGFAVHSHATKSPLSGKHNFPCTEIFPLRYRAYQTHLCRRCYVSTPLEVFVKEPLKFAKEFLKALFLS